MSTHVPMRQCLGCREMKPKREMLRVVRQPSKDDGQLGEITLDLRGKVSGRGAYVCFSEACFKRAVKSRALSRALDAQIPDDIIERLAEEISRELNNNGK